MRKPTASLEKRLLEYLAGPRYAPLRQHELADALGIGKRAELRSLLRQLEHEGKIQCLRKNRYALARPSEQTVGRLSVHPMGFGFVTTETPGVPDVFIERDRMGTALHGDKVVVEITGRQDRPGPRGRGRPGEQQPRVEGRILRSLERKLANVVGILSRTGHEWYVIPDNPKVRHTIHVREFASAIAVPHPGHKAVITLDPWDDPNMNITGVVIEDLGPADAPGVDVLSIMRDHDIHVPFKEQVLEEARSQSATLRAADLHGRRDLRNELVITIDPDDAKDFDDAVTLMRGANGNWILDVHIADVAHFVRPGTEVDREARKRGNSIYMVDRFVPMLPQYLTAEVCSLKPDVDRLTHSVRMELGPDGEMIGYETFASVIHSKARLTYDQVQLFMDKKGNHGIPDGVQEMVGQMDALARKIREARIDAGAIDLSMPEVKCILDDQGHAVKIFKRGANDAYHLIEEFMLLANVAVADFLVAKKVPAMFRVHLPPGEDQWAQMAVDLQALGLEVVPQDRADLNDVARKVRGTPLEYAGNLAILRNLKRAMYSSVLDEHFGLAFEKYTHFTSPIRRYPDLLVHRALKAAEHGRTPPYDADEMAGLAQHCSETEWNASEAEDQSLAIKRLEFYATKLEAREAGPHDALIVDVVARGLIVEILETLQRGMVHFASIMDDHYTTDAARRRAVGERKRRVFHVGQNVSVELIKVDMARRQVDFRLAAAAPAREERGKPGRGKRRQRMR